MQIVTLIGNRPQFVKAAAVSKLLRERHAELLVHSGQHYDDEMSKVFFDELDLPAADIELAVGPCPAAEQVARIMHAFEPALREAQADLVLVYGDTTTTLAGALTAAKIGAPLAHIEAGMRSFDRSMPEERNRIIADHLSALCLCPTPVAVENLRNESVRGDVELVGDVMADVSIAMMPVAEQRSTVLDQLGVGSGDYLVVTAHRAGNVDDPERLQQLVELIESLPGSVVFPVHPRTKARLESAGLLARLQGAQGLQLTAPLGYLDFLRLLGGARAMLTDSGGVQKEAYLASVPCITLRDTTEWVETIELGWNRLVDLDPGAALAALESLPNSAEHPELYGGGKAGEATVAAIDRWLGSRAA